MTPALLRIAALACLAGGGTWAAAAGPAGPVLLSSSSRASSAARLPPLAARSTLDVYFVDVEGGQATLFVAASGESMLVDAGFPGHDDRDAKRIASAAADAGVTRIDYLLVTHYHRDHVGGVPALAARLPVGAFVDHGASVEQGAGAAALYEAYLQTRAKGRHLQVAPGDTIPVSGLDVRVVASGGELLAASRPGGAARNPHCESARPREADPSENARSVGIVVRHGGFRLLNLGDLTWNKELELACPENRIGRVDVYLTTHHGLAPSGPPALVRAVAPRVAVMNNGARKGGAPEAWRIVRDAPRLEDLWQLHRSEAGGADHNAPDAFIANPDETSAHWIKLSARTDGSFVVTNGRTGFSKQYAAPR
jgi:beta-lactamase superfamily II metal-dependent hydrolase